MGFFDRLREKAADVVSQASAGAERLAKHVAAHGPAIIAESASELIAEREYHKARELGRGGLGPDNAQAILDGLAPYAEVDGTCIVLINRLLGDACVVLEREVEAEHYLKRSLSLFRDAANKRDAEPRIIEELEIMPHEFEAQLLIGLASLALARGDYDICIRHCMQAIGEDRHQSTAFYLQAKAMLKRGLPADIVGETLVKALDVTPPKTVLAWVAELLPEQVDWFRRLVP